MATFCWAMNCHKFMQGHISVFLGIEIKDEFPAWRNDLPLLNFKGKETSKTFDSAKRKGETITLRSRMVNSIVLRVVQVVGTIHNPCLKSIPLLFFTGSWGLGIINERVANQSSRKNSNLVSSTRRLVVSRQTHAPNIDLVRAVPRNLRWNRDFEIVPERSTYTRPILPRKSKHALMVSGIWPLFCRMIWTQTWFVVQLSRWLWFFKVTECSYVKWT